LSPNFARICIWQATSRKEQGEKLYRGFNQEVTAVSSWVCHYLREVEVEVVRIIKRHGRPQLGFHPPSLSFIFISLKKK